MDTPITNDVGSIICVLRNQDEDKFFGTDDKGQELWFRKGQVIAQSEFELKPLTLLLIEMFIIKANDI